MSSECAKHAYVTPPSPEWLRMWRSLESLGEDIDAETDGERWQYMGSFNEGRGWHHEFRHRAHPGVVQGNKAHGRKILYVPATRAWGEAPR